MKRSTILICLCLLLMSTMVSADWWDDLMETLQFKAVQCDVEVLINDSLNDYVFPIQGDYPIINVDIDAWKTDNWKDYKTTKGKNPGHFKLYKGSRTRIKVTIPGFYQKKVFHYDGEHKLKYKFDFTPNNKLTVYSQAGNFSPPRVAQAKIDLRWKKSDGTWQVQTKHTDSAGKVVFEGLYAGIEYLLAGWPDDTLRLEPSLFDKAGTFSNYYQTKTYTIHHPGKVTHAKPIPNVQPSAPVN